MTGWAADRRVFLFQLLDEAPPEPVRPLDEGRRLLGRLFLPHLRASYVAAARPWPEDTEDLVHDVRVATRRLVENLALARPMLGAKVSRRAARRAKRLRRALGAPRESDVLVADFRRLAESAGLAASAVHALDAIAEHGEEALEAVKREYPPERLLGDAVDLLVATTTPKRVLPLHEVAGLHLYSRLETARALLPALEQDGAWALHHDLRIACKQIRYAVEALGPAFAEALQPERTIQRMKKFQDALGVLNDAQDLIEWLSRPFVVDALGPKLLRKVRDAAETERSARYETARGRVLADAPPVFAELRRGAGLIGPLP